MTKGWIKWAGIGLAALLLFVGPLQAQNLSDFDYENLSFRGLSLETGVVIPNKVNSATSFNVKVDLGFLGPNVRIAPFLGFWRSEFKRKEVTELERRLADLIVRTDTAASATVDLGVVEWSDLVMGVDGEYVWPAGSRIEIALGIGAAAHFMNGEGAAIKDTFVEDLLDRVTIGANSHLGLAFALAPQFRVTGQLRYEILDDLNYPEIRVGGLFVFGGRREP